MVSAVQGLQVEAERRGDKSDPLTDRAGGQTGWSLFDEQSIDGEPVLVGECPERLDDFGCLHGGVRYFENSRNVNHALRWAH